ncbi:hypothetical protein NIES4106_53960 (plasmid) [Fischerella sp. NIES-4106]|jgi:predicted pyridoxine 5'-phosphate oxidase superfamily flavin-nucleotide-binding protein|nr:hypothetical protein NIES4106_53960 [Fischerella sp. NIES-4106]
MAYHTYKSPLLWLASTIKDSRVSVTVQPFCQELGLVTEQSLDLRQLLQVIFLIILLL